MGHASDAKTNPGVKKNTHTTLAYKQNPRRLVFVHSIILCGSDFGSKGSDLGFTWFYILWSKKGRTKKYPLKGFNRI